MDEIERLLAHPGAADPSFTLRGHRPGDMGWITHRQAVLYAAEYGWDESFEALAAEIAASFLRNFDPVRERCWIAERQGEVVGSIFCVGESETLAKLRLLYVEAAREDSASDAGSSPNASRSPGRRATAP